MIDCRVRGSLCRGGLTTCNLEVICNPRVTLAWGESAMMTMTGQDRVREQRRRRWKLAGVMAALVTGLATAAVGYGYVRAGLSAGGAVAVAIGCGIGVALVAAIKAWNLRPWDRRWQSEPAHVRRDRLQARRNRMLWAFPMASLAFLLVAVRAWEDVRVGGASVVDHMQLAVPVVYSWVVAIVVMGWDFQSRTHRKYLDDELTGLMRARALGAAFVVLMGTGTVALGVSLWRPEWGVLALITALTLGGAAAGLRFAWLDYEAGLPKNDAGPANG